MNAHDVLAALSDKSTDSEVLDALIRALFVCDGGHGSRGAELVRHTLQRARRAQVQAALWPETGPGAPKGDGPSLGGPLTSGEAPAQEPEPEPQIRTRKKRDSAELG